MDETGRNPYGKAGSKSEQVLLPWATVGRRGLSNFRPLQTSTGSNSTLTLNPKKILSAKNCTGASDGIGVWNLSRN
jgi:hypothetical protein